jgi:hypothetical protein
MEEMWKQQLKRLRDITPDAAWSAKTKRAVFASRAPEVLTPRIPVSIFSFPRLLWVGVPVVVLMLLFTSVYFFASPSQGAISSLDKDNLNTEFNSLSLNVHLQSVSYKDSANSAVASALQEITDTGAKHLSPALLESEIEILQLDTNLPTQEKSIDELLNEVIL